MIWAAEAKDATLHGYAVLKQIKIRSFPIVTTQLYEVGITATNSLAAQDPDVSF
jgi:hypothetical protein